MTDQTPHSTTVRPTNGSIRARWAAIGAALAVILGAGGMGIARAAEPSGAVAFVPITPCRIFDTRPGVDNVGPKSSPFGPGETLTVSVHGDPGQCTGIPATATGVSLNVTTVDASLLTFLTIWPTGQTRPLASSLNPSPGQPPTPNAVTSALSPGGQLDIFNLQGSVHVLADVNGYYTDHQHDDRYYTKAQTDTAIASQPWSESLPVESTHFIDDPSTIHFEVAGGGSSGTNGLWLENNGFARFFTGFTLPPTYQDGTGVRIDFTWVAEATNTAGCTFRFETNSLEVNRAGSQRIVPTHQFETPVGFGGFASTHLVAPSSPGPGNGFLLVRQATHLTIDGTNLRSGDHVQVAFNRRSDHPNDTCADALILTGMNAGPG